MPPEKPFWTRRALLATGVAAGMAGLTKGFAAADVAQTAPSSVRSDQRRRSLRFAHLTDIHVQPEREAAEGFAACLRHVQSVEDAPEFIMTGGDLIMDAFRADHDRTKVQWDLFAKVVSAECSLPVEHCIGNHDVWSFQSREDNAEHAAKAVKRWALAELGLESPYRTFVRGGWRFVVLDSTFPSGSSYTARLDDEQFEWLRHTLREGDPGQPVLIVSHIPILAACAYFDGDNEKSGNWVVPGAWMHIDARRIKDLFRQHPNVRAAISGHIHLIDRVEYLGVSYLCHGAVCGGWWSGDYQECAPGYALVDLFDDGTIESQYVAFGWTPRT
ncbi:MAG: metallophosphoesterase [Fimbriimonadaceae bacterium]